MNTIMATGWLIKDAWTTTQTGTFRQILCFDLMLAAKWQGRAEAAPWRCEIDDEADVKHVAAKLVAGAGVMIRGELCARPFVKHGVTEGFTRWIAVDRVEFSRVPRTAEQQEART